VIPLQNRCGPKLGLLFHDCGTRRGWVVSSTPRPHFTPGKDPVPILKEAGWAPGPVWTGGNTRPHQDSIPDRPAHSQSLHRLSYPAHNLAVYTLYIYIYIWRNTLPCILMNNQWQSNQQMHFTKEILWHSPRDRIFYSVYDSYPVTSCQKTLRHLAEQEKRNSSVFKVFSVSPSGEMWAR